MKQCHATVEDNRFFQSLQSTTSNSSSTVTFNPNEGLQEVIVTLQLNPPGGGGAPAGTGLALPLGWGYSLLRRIGYRYGSSQLYYITGSQNLIQTLSLCEDSGKKQQMMFLGGQALTTPADWADPAKRTAYVYLRLPHSSPALSGGALPFPSDILTAPIQLQLDLADFSKVISSVAGADNLPPTQLSLGQVNFTQVTMQDAGDLIARRFDMSKHALTIPLPEGWTQEEVTFGFTAPTDGGFSLSLTGCKAGDLKKLRVWFSYDDDVTGRVNGGLKQNIFVPPSSIRFAINGLIYLDSQAGSYLLNNVIRRRTPPSITTSQLALGQAGAPAIVANPVASTWVEIDLATPYTIGNTAEVALLHGVPVMNSVLNLTGNMPTAGAYTCHVEYVLNCSWMASRGSAEFVF
jgi:hypothetical protein